MSLSAVAQSTAPATPAPAQQKTPAGGLEPGAPPLQLQNLPPDDHTLTPAEIAQEREQRAYQAAIRIASLQARWGPAMSTPGVSVSLVETGRTKTADGATQLTYQIAGSGFRAGEELSLVRWQLGDSVKTVMDGLVLNAQGRAVCAPPAPAATAAPAAPASASPAAPAPPAPSGSSSVSAPAPQANAGTAPVSTVPSCIDTMERNQPLQIQTTAAPGEAVRVALVGTDRSNGAATEVVPFPIVNRSESCSLQVVLGMRDADLDLVEANGFPPNSTLKLDVTTDADSHTLNTHTTAQGSAVMAFFPSLRGETGGDTTIRFAGIVHPPSHTPPAGPAPSDPTCTPAVSFHWGRGTYKPE